MQASLSGPCPAQQQHSLLSPHQHNALRSRVAHRRAAAAQRRWSPPTAAAAAVDVAVDDGPSTSGRPPVLDYRPTPDAPGGAGFIDPKLPAVQPWVRPYPATYTPPSIRDSGTLHPGSEWFPAWMQYRQREDNSVFWQDKFSRCSLDVPDMEKRWTLFSSLWYLWQELRFIGTPPALRYLAHLAWRALMARAYEAHKALVLWQAKMDAGLAARVTGGTVATFSRAMALRRLHWKNGLLGELLYAINVSKTGRVHMLPPVKQPPRRPTFFFVF